MVVMMTPNVAVVIADVMIVWAELRGRSGLGYSRSRRLYADTSEDGSELIHEDGMDLLGIRGSVPSRAPAGGPSG